MSKHSEKVLQQQKAMQQELLAMKKENEILKSHRQILRDVMEYIYNDSISRADNEKAAIKALNDTEL